MTKAKFDFITPETGPASETQFPMATFGDIKPTATYTATEAKQGYEASVIPRELAYAVSRNALPRNQRVILDLRGDTGFGKSGTVNYVLKQLIPGKRKVVSLYMPWVRMEKMQLMLPYVDENGERRLATSTSKALLDADVLVLEESQRVRDQQVKNMMMEFIEGSLGGQKLKDNLTIIHVNNHEKEGGVFGKDDLAQATRKRVVMLTQDDMPWQVALAHIFPTTNLNKLFSEYALLRGAYPEAMLHVPPRTLEHIIFAAGYGLPAAWGLPLIRGERQKLLAASDDPLEPSKDITVEVLKTLCKALGVTYIPETTSPELVQKAFDITISAGTNLKLVGPHGIGKTSFTAAKVADMGLKTVHMQLPNVAANRHVVSIPDAQDKSVIKTVISDLFNPRFAADGDLAVLHVDEPDRARPEIQNVLLEVAGPTRKLGDQKLPFKAIIATDNPATVAGQKMALTGGSNRALAERFHLSLILDAEAFGFRDHLFNKWGQTASPFLDWWDMDLSDTARQLISPRTLEQMMDTYDYFSQESKVSWVEVKEAVMCSLPIMGQNRLGSEFLPQLYARLSPSSRSIDLIDLVKFKQEHLDNLTGDDTAARQETHLAIMQVLRNTAPAALTGELDTLFDLLSVDSQAGSAFYNISQIADGDQARKEVLTTLSRRLNRVARQKRRQARAKNK